MKRIWIVTGFLLWASTALANSTDSLKIALDYQKEPIERIGTLYSLAWELVGQGDETALDYIQEGLTLGETEEFTTQIANFYYLLGYYHHNHSFDYQQAYLAFTFARERYIDLDNKKYAGRAGIHLAQYLYETEQFDAAASLYKEIQIQFLDENSTYDLAVVHENIAYMHQKQGDLTQAIGEFSLAHSYYQQNNHAEGQIKMALDLGNAYRRSGDYTSAMYHIEQALSLTELQKQSHPDYSYALFQKGMIQQDQGLFAEATASMQESYSSAYQMNPGHQNTFNMANILADLLLTQGLAGQAVALMEQQIEHLPSGKLHHYQLATYAVAAKAYEAQESWPNALAMERAYSANAVAMPEADAQAAMAQKTTEVALAQQYLAERVAESAQRRMRRTWILCLALIVLVALGAYLHLFQIKEKHRKQALANATHWPELNKKMQDLEEALHLIG